VLLFDNGDNIQGNPFGEYLSKNPPVPGKISPIMTVLNSLAYDAMTLGDHEFNFGLDYLNSVIGGAKFPVVCANVLNALTKTPYFRPYVILTKTFRDRDNKLQILRVGVLGLVTPQIVSWDEAWLRGRVETADSYETARKYVPEMKAAGADIVVILSHSGIQDFPRKGGEENFSHYLTTIPGVDVVISGHTHETCPGRAVAGTQEADNAKGTINGIPVVMPGSFADTLGEIRITIEKNDGRWERTDGSGALIPVYDTEARKAYLPQDWETADLLTATHNAVLDYIRAPVDTEEVE
jgi:2',3'-cyclic-nucleotide 2'-phosphodiesterase/3'-nucleotidase